MSSSDRFHRIESSTQTEEIARLQVSTGEIWGTCGRYGYTITVKAYPGAISERRGVEFTTDIEPEPNAGAPNMARWYYPDTKGVEHRVKDGRDYACIFASVTNFQPSKGGEK